MVDAIIYTRLRASVHLHNVLYGFHTWRVTGDVILELNLAKDLARMDHDPLFLVFLDMHKTYDTIYYGCIMMTMEVYGAVPCMCRLLAVLWDQQEVVTHQNGYHGPHFKSTWWKTEGRLIFPTLFNFIVNNVVRKLLAMTVEDQLIEYERLVIVVGRCLGLFHEDNIIVL